MSEIATAITNLREVLPATVKCIAVSKTKPAGLIAEAYQAGQRDFGENYVQELTDKYESLEKDIQWHMIGHLQSNKVKYIAPFVAWIHAVDSVKLLEEINRQAAKHHRTICCLLQIHIAQEESKFGFSEDEVLAFANTTDFDLFPYAKVCGVMGMASFSEDTNLIRNEFKGLKNVFDKLKETRFAANEEFREISMGMSSDWRIAIEEGSTMVRIGSAIFGAR